MPDWTTVQDLVLGVVPPDATLCNDIDLVVALQVLRSELGLEDDPCVPLHAGVWELKAQVRNLTECLTSCRQAYEAIHTLLVDTVDPADPAASQ